MADIAHIAHASTFHLLLLILAGEKQVMRIVFKSASHLRGEYYYLMMTLTDLALGRRSGEPATSQRTDLEVCHLQRNT